MYYRLRDVIREMRADHDIDVLYNKAWRENKYTQNLIYGDPLLCFQLLLAYNSN